MGGTLFSIATFGRSNRCGSSDLFPLTQAACALLVPLLGCLAIVWFYWIPDLQKREAE